jgi:hypothetical protein
MGRGPCAFTEADLRRAVKAITAAGQPVRGVRFHPDGGFTVIIGGPASNVDDQNEWDEVYGQNQTGVRSGVS